MKQIALCNSPSSIRYCYVTDANACTYYPAVKIRVILIQLHGDPLSLDNDSYICLLNEFKGLVVRGWLSGNEEIRVF